MLSQCQHPFKAIETVLSLYFNTVSVSVFFLTYVREKIHENNNIYYMYNARA